MTWQDYFESHYETLSLFDEIYWDGGLTILIVESINKNLTEKAKAEHILITDENSFDYENYLFNAYKFCEKGLS